jgi:hypothetical protein
MFSLCPFCKNPECTVLKKNKPTVAFHPAEFQIFETAELASRKHPSKDVTFLPAAQSRKKQFENS